MERAITGVPFVVSELECQGVPLGAPLIRHLIRHWIEIRPARLPGPPWTGPIPARPGASVRARLA